jgi:hypothetical protein
MKVPVAGWFSVEKTGATAGDLLAKDLVCEWGKQAGYAYDIALASQFGVLVDWAVVDPSGELSVGGDQFVYDGIRRFVESI